MCIRDSLYGNARAIHANDGEWGDYIGLFNDISGKRQIVIIDVFDIITSCGYAVPQMELVEQRDILVDWADKKGEEGIKNYWKEKNQKSFDGFETKVPIDW